MNRSERAAGLPEPRRRQDVALDDLHIRLAGIPLFGVVIPNLTGLFGTLGPRDLPYWLGYVWFVALSAAIWQGNRFFLLEQRRHYDWFDHPWRKVAVLLFANVFYTAPLTVAMLWGWYRARGLEVDVQAVRVVALANVICVVFITHVYETVYLIQQRESDLVAVARLDRARAEAELAALRSQVDPHFLFNSLNTLAHLIPTDPAAALRFTEGLADIYRYVLTSRHRDLVPLSDEMRFAEAYVGLLQLRFGDAVSLRSDVPAEPGVLVPAVSLQLLLENAVKHNAFDRASPLDIQVTVAGDRIRVENPRRPRATREGSPETGLQNLDERCRRITGRGIEVDRGGPTFSVALPLLRTTA